MSLFLASMVVFCSTQPPVYGAGMVTILPYGKPLPYFFSVLSVATGLEGLIAGATAVFAMQCANPMWFHKVRHPVHVFPHEAQWSIKQQMMGSRPRIWATLVILASPFIALILSIGFTTVGE